MVAMHPRLQSGNSRAQTEPRFLQQRRQPQQHCHSHREQPQQRKLCSESKGPIMGDYVLDPRGDICIILERSGKEPNQYLVSSRHLGLASVVFEDIIETRSEDGNAEREVGNDDEDKVWIPVLPQDRSFRLAPGGLPHGFTGDPRSPWRSSIYSHSERDLRHRRHRRVLPASGCNGHVIQRMDLCSHPPTLDVQQRRRMVDFVHGVRQGGNIPRYGRDPYCGSQRKRPDRHASPNRESSSR